MSLYRHGDETSFLIVVDSGKQCLRAFFLYVAEAHYEDCTQNILSFICLFMDLFKLETDEVTTFCLLFSGQEKFSICVSYRGRNAKT